MAKKEGGNGENNLTHGFGLTVTTWVVVPSPTLKDARQGGS